MRLLDRVSQCGEPIILLNNDGTQMVLPGADRFSASVRECPQRFVLDANASALCLSFLQDNLDMLEPASGLLRMPAPAFWLEWLEPANSAAGELQKAGIFVEGDASGRRGRLRSFWEEDGQISIAAGALVFDLDQPPRGSGEAGKVARFHHATVPALEPLLAHVIFEIDPEWSQYIAYHGPSTAKDAVRRAAEACWYDLPITLAFGLLLSLRGPLRSLATDLGRLNLARARRGKAPLLDHVEVGLALGENGAMPYQSERSGRATPRLHQVRGHIVRRGEALFWRSSHLRGNADGALLRRTVQVTARGL